MRNVLFSLLLILPLGACHVYTNVPAVFGVNNPSPDAVQTYVNNEAVGPIVAANGTAEFQISIPVAFQSGSTGPIEETTQVVVTFKNQRTGVLLPTITCQAGAKIITNTQHVELGTSEYITCNPVTSYNLVPADTLRQK